MIVLGMFSVSASEIPHFKEVVIMATSCDYCGHKTNEVKSGGGIEPRGTRITLKITDPSDLSRDVLKVSEKYVHSFKERHPNAEVCIACEL